MWPYASATLKSAARSPVGWTLLAAGGFAGWFAAAAAILALTEVGGQALPLTMGTAQLVGVLLAIWLVGRGLDEDRHSGFAQAADAAAPGPAGRVLGRWMGASLAACLLSVLTACLIATSESVNQPPYLLLLSTSSFAAAHVAAWTLCLGTIWRGGGAGMAVFLLWVLGHLPWGIEPFLAPGPGRLVSALLPGPVNAGTPSALGYTSAAVAGLLLLTLALSRPANT